MTAGFFDLPHRRMPDALPSASPLRREAHHEVEARGQLAGPRIFQRSKIHGDRGPLRLVLHAGPDAVALVGGQNSRFR